jgi:hypothetical protein
MTTRKPAKEVKTRDVPLTAQQVDKLNLYSARLQDAQQRLNEYLTAVTDAEGLEGKWVSDGIEGDPPVLKLKRPE